MPRNGGRETAACQTPFLRTQASENGICRLSACKTSPMTDERVRSPGVAFLLSQLGGQSAKLWTARLARHGLEPREVMLFRHIALAQGRSQRDLAQAIGLPESRIVGLVDRLEARGWIERRTSPGDRRVRALHLTSRGRGLLKRIMSVSAEHEAELIAGLAPDERDVLIGLLMRIAQRQGLVAGVHPGFDDAAADQTRDADADSPTG
jgi:DNA-binding MarR family transcriptional regulator